MFEGTFVYFWHVLINCRGEILSAIPECFEMNVCRSAWKAEEASGRRHLNDSCVESFVMMKRLSICFEALGSISNSKVTHIQLSNPHKYRLNWFSLELF
ncbi:hypothetical protein NPIL_641521 [Nephila pilipes]|uniref:Uncharacterized protein n=1 Tax=Nephila pilipes TaxID=299642 RepID=A0A8X6MS61_NEPPI|nr:hypothetical protein NPIL_641521 [Nephila pilipes]